MLNTTGVDHRRDIRTRISEFIECRWDPADIFHLGWVLESSQSGLAFAWRGDNAPPVDAIIDVRDDALPVGAACCQAVVRRSSVVHDDLNVVALEFLSFSPFPPQPQALPAQAVELHDAWLPGNMAVQAA